MAEPLRPGQARVGVIGLGIMGSGMAANLLRAGFEVTVYNRTPDKTGPLRDKGARVARTPAELASGCDAVVTMVSDVPALEQVLLGPQGAFSGTRPGTLFIDSSTVTPEASLRMAQEARRRGCEYLDAPVVGSRQAAQEGQLMFMVGGSEEVFERARPLFSAMGRVAYRVGPNGHGSAVKLINNMIAGVTLAAIAEGAAVAQAAGLDPKALLQVLSDSVIGSPFLKSKLPKVLQRDFSTHFALALMQKDLRYFLDLAGRHDRFTPTAALAAQLYQAARLAGWGELDTAALFGYVAGLTAPQSDG